MVRPRRLLPIAAAIAVAAAVAIPLAVADELDPNGSETVAEVVEPAAPAAPPAPGIRYVALGDSYTSAPGVTPVDSTAPPACGRSAVNYPHLVAEQLGAQLTDVSCGGAQTMSLYDAQFSGVDAQLDALRPDTTLVTLGIGGNDNDLFATAVAGCAAQLGDVVAGDPAPCRTRYAQQFSEDIAASGVMIKQALVNINAEAPQAQVVVVGYPNLFPTTPAGRLTCAAAGVPFTPDDIEFLDGVERELNAALATAATETKNTYLDTYTPSLGHDMCTAPGTRWIEPTIPLAPAAPVHPNAAGQAAVAAGLAAVVRPRPTA
ncbi:SGNH/GDSL hydrolase family protein [Sporichthya sp.]|uniref:SGNH/GDSL hydrolase family protein n=1 Tax=Sporichthya sp. TaxID=65475 RepID=UPI00182154E3|nr:SGNH/GDSL hydrolase family protein [Sporichthya sp.]MBA3745143.1 SGNH/GDSL hydrolase family protein [Sporichthya sp.]